MLHAALALSLSICAQSTQTPAPSWRTVERPGKDPLRYLVSAPPEELHEPASLLFVVTPNASDATSVELALAQVDAPSLARSGWIVAAAADPLESFDPVVDDVRAKLSLDDARVHLTGWGDGGRDALRLAAREPERVASVIACAPTALGDADLAALDALVETSVAMIRGREDDRAPMLAVLERLIELGNSSATLDFASNAAHATPRDSEGRFAERLARLRSDERERARVESEVRARLDGFHAAASKADGPGYYACLAPDATFVGTDARERWSVAQFRAYCEPYFRQGKGWTYRATERHVRLSPDRQVAWFDERLANDKYGEVRGSGVLRRIGSSWRIAQYVMSFPVPNELSAELVRRTKELGR